MLYSKFHKDKSSCLITVFEILVQNCFVKDSSANNFNQNEERVKSQELFIYNSNYSQKLNIFSIQFILMFEYL